MVNIVYNCISVAFSVNISVLYMKFMAPPLPLFERIILELYIVLQLHDQNCVRPANVLQ